MVAPVELEEGDPGLRLFFSEPGIETERVSAEEEVLDRYQAKVTIKVRALAVSYKLEWLNVEKARYYPSRLDENLIGDVDVQIRYFPRRAGLLAGIENIDGRHAKRWLKERSGVRVIDRGFRLLPYGQPDDDWLWLSSSKANRDRTWRSQLLKTLAPEDKRNKEERKDPLLKVPANHQLLGVVQVTSARPTHTDAHHRKLQPAMDRQGFIENEGFAQLRDIVRAAVELIAIVDIEEAEKAASKRAKAQARETKKNLQNIIAGIKSDGDIPPATKKELVRNYELVLKDVSQFEETQKRARTAVETMSLLGVLSGFMTHELTVMLRSAERMLEVWDDIPKASRGPEIEEAQRVTREALRQLRSHLDYAETFISHTRVDTPRPFKARAQVDLVVRQLLPFATERKIEVRNNVNDKTIVNGIAVGVFSGILLNLYSNAIKAILAARVLQREKVIAIECDVEEKWYTLKVSDSGIGIPEGAEGQIFEPLFTTTDDSPLGSSMGLGLYIVKRLVTDLGGKVSLGEPPSPFSTTFEVRFPHVR
jgi:signal transduction histidine kinase